MYSDDIVYTKPSEDLEDIYSGERQEYLPYYTDDKYYIHYEIGLTIFSNLTVDGWKVEVLDNPFDEDQVSVRVEEDEKVKEEYVVVDCEVDLGKKEIMSEYN